VRDNGDLDHIGVAAAPATGQQQQRQGTETRQDRRMRFAKLHDFENPHIPAWRFLPSQADFQLF
jgi:hypothetical protein